LVSSSFDLGTPRHLPTARVGVLAFEFTPCSRARRGIVRDVGQAVSQDGERNNHEMSVLDWQTFVLQRRINRPSQEVLHAISNPAVFGSGAVLSSDANGALRLD
jgi:hypothetical protein